MGIRTFRKINHFAKAENGLKIVIQKPKLKEKSGKSDKTD